MARLHVKQKPFRLSDVMKMTATEKALMALLMARRGRLGGQARAASMTPAKRSAIARKAAKARWSKRHAH
jgi:hypothetical protein